MKTEIKYSPEEVLKARGIEPDGEVHSMSTIQVTEAMKEYARYAVDAQRDIMARHLNMRNVPTPWTEK